MWPNSMPQSVVTAINSLGWDMVASLSANDIPSGGTAASPLSITITLLMFILIGDEDGTQRREFCKKFGIDEHTELASRFSRLQNTLTRASGPRQKFQCANGLFAIRSTVLSSTGLKYLEALNAHVNTGFPGPSLKGFSNEINAWVSQKTEGLISSLVGEASMVNAYLVLVNALVFKAKWMHKFDPKHTIENFPFRAEYSKPESVEMMFHHEARVLHFSGNGYTAVRLPYASSEWSFIAYLPDENKSVSDILPEVSRQDIRPDFTECKFSRFGLPKFDLRTNGPVTPILADLGYPIPMGSIVIHSVTILLDEDGTKAAAATAMIFRGSRPRPSPTLIFDRPFVFSIVAHPTNLVLFMGVFSA